MAQVLASPVPHGTGRLRSGDVLRRIGLLPPRRLEQIENRIAIVKSAASARLFRSGGVRPQVLGVVNESFIPLSYRPGPFAGAGILMTRRAVDLKRARVLAETSLRRIASLQHGADPKNYALWYSVAAGDHGTLRHAVDQLIARKRGLSRQDIDTLHDNHVASGNAAEKVERVGAQFADEISQIADMIETAREIAAVYSKKLSDVRRGLDSIRDREGARTAIRGLLDVTGDMQADNVALRTKLTASWREVADLRGTLGALRKDSLADPLTSLGNRHYFNRCLAGA